MRQELPSWPSLINCKGETDMCNASVNKTVRLPLTKTEEAAKRIAAGQSLGKVLRHFNLIDDHERMPTLGQGRHGASQVVDGYRRQAIEDVQNMQINIYGMFVNAKHNHDNPGDLTDIQLNEISLTCEIVTNSIQKFLRAKEAGSNLMGGDHVDG